MSHAGIPEGQQALNEGLPSIALARLAEVDAQALGEKERREYVLLLVKAHLADGNPTKALESLQSAPEAGTPEFRFWQAEALAALGRPGEALTAYGDAESFSPEESLRGRARMLISLGRAQEAYDLLQRVTDNPGVVMDSAEAALELGKTVEAMTALQALPEMDSAKNARRNYLLAKAVLMNGDPRRALEILSRDSRPGHGLATRWILLKAECQLAAGDVDAAETTLEKFIEDHPQVEGLGAVMEGLDGVYQSQKSPSSTELRRWASDEAHPGRAASAQFYLARNEVRLERPDRAAEAYRDFLTGQAGHSLAPRAREELARLLLGRGDAAGALQTLGEAQGVSMDFLRGMAHAAAGRFDLAAESFDAAAKSSDGQGAQFNAALSRILAGQDPGEISFDGPPKMTAELQFAAALMAAQKRDPGTPARLEAVIEKSQPPWSDSAALALAEWNYLQLDLPGAREQLRRISNNASGDTTSRAAALSVFLEDDGSEDSADKVLAAGQKFLEEHGNTEARAEVLLKMGEIHFRRGDYLSAQSLLLEAAAEKPTTPLAEKALFLAAQSASRSMTDAGTAEALELYEDVARAGGPLALRARFAQALLLNALNRYKEALPVLDRILASSPDEDLRHAALIEKGDTYFVLGQTDPSAYAEAIAAWRLAADPSAPARWRNQALVKIGAASEKLGEIPAALSSYHDVLAMPPGEEPEYFWFYKAGFDAARLLESQGKASEAIVIYEKLAAREGPRSEEARQRLNTLRLENFLWDDPPAAESTP